MENNVCMEYKVVFDYTGEGYLASDKVIQSALSEVLATGHNEFCKAVNPHIDEWNKEAETLGFKASEDYDSDYMKFMLYKYRRTLIEMLDENEVFKMLFDVSDATVFYDWDIGDELELHLKLTALCIDSWIDVSFHLEAA